MVIHYFFFFRTIDVVFNSIGELQTNKFQLKPDKCNGFEILSEEEAVAERHQESVKNMRTPSRRRGVGSVNVSAESDSSRRQVDPNKLTVDEDMQYTVFVSYVEIYNNYTYDLLDQPKQDPVTGKQKLSSKILRADR